MAKSKFFSNSQTHGKIIIFKISKHETPVTTQDNNAHLNYLMVKKLKIPDAKIISQLWRKNLKYFCKNSISNNSKTKKDSSSDLSLLTLSSSKKKLEIAQLISNCVHHDPNGQLRCAHSSSKDPISHFENRLPTSRSKKIILIFFKFRKSNSDQHMTTPTRDNLAIASCNFALVDDTANVNASPIYHTEVLGSSSKNPNRLLIEVLGPPSSGSWVNETKKVDVSPLELSSMSLRLTPNEFPTATLVVIPDLTPTVTPSGSPTVTQTANSTLTFAKTDFHLGSDYETDEDFDDESSSRDILSDHDSGSPSDSLRATPTLTLPTSLSISALVFSPLVSTALVFSPLVATE